MQLGRLCDIRSAFTVALFQLIDRHGWEVITAVAKITWSVSAQGRPSLTLPQQPIRPVPSYRGDAGHSSLQSFADRVDYKPGTDVVMVGFAYPPADRQVTRQRVSLRLVTGQRILEKAVLVYGPRFYHQSIVGKVTPGRAEPLSKTPLIYELAYGGVDQDPQEGILIEKRNPAGIGVAHNPLALLGRPTPQIEDAGGRPPAGFGPIAPSWSPRVELAGTYDAEWQKRRAPLLPLDFDSRHSCVAHPDLHSPEALHGDEAVEILGATPEGQWRFKLPRYEPRFEAVVRGERQVLETHLDTFFIDAEERRVELCWRASVKLPRKREHLEKIIIGEQQPLPDHFLHEAWRKQPPGQPDEQTAPLEKEPWMPLTTT